jgi:hypothetical protein
MNQPGTRVAALDGATTAATSRTDARAARVDRPASIDAGGLMNYGPNQTEMWRRSAVYIDRRQVYWAADAGGPRA